jgi:hypothetical protein
VQEAAQRELRAAASVPLLAHTPRPFSVALCALVHTGVELQPRNTNISFDNNSNVVMNVIAFMFYPDETVIYVETGIVTKSFFLKL